MADFLGSILGTMAGPPKASEKEIAERKKARELAKKLEERNKQESKVFRQKIEQQIDTFLKGSLDNRNMTFEVMPKVRNANFNPSYFCFHLLKAQIGFPYFE